MKKIISSILIASFIICTNICVLAADFKATTPSASNAVEGTYTDDKYSEDITSLITEVLNLTDSKDVIQQLSIESNSDKPVIAVLKLEIADDKASDTGYSAIDYIDFRISSRDGNILFEDDATRSTSINERSIILGTFNESVQSDSQLFNIRMSSNDAIKYTDLKNSVSDIKWTLELNTDVEGVVNSMSTPTQTPETTPVPPQKVITINIGDKTDKANNLVAKGIYVLFGSGSCNITSKDGSKNITFSLNSDESKGKTVSLDSGDTVVVTGDSNAKVQFGTPKTAATTSKANPKTGDEAPLTAISTLAVLAVLGMLFGVFYKRKED